MLTIEPDRTNQLPRTLLTLCLILLLLRGATICYAVYNPPPRAKDLLLWQQAKSIDPNRKDLLGRPTLYYFTDQKDVWGVVWTHLYENMLFNNREIVEFIREHFITVKVVRTSAEPQQPFDDLANELTYDSFPCLVIALPNGAKVASASWQSDRMFLAFLQDGLVQRLSSVAEEGMKTGNYALACEGYAKDNAAKLQSHRWLNRDSRMSNAIYWAIALRHEKRDAEASEVLKNAIALAHKQFANELYLPYLRYLAGEITVDEMFKKAGKGEWEQITGRYVVGAKSSLDGNLEEAKRQLRLVIAKKSNSSFDACQFAKAELRRLGQSAPGSETD